MRIKKILLLIIVVFAASWNGTKHVRTTSKRKKRCIHWKRKWMGSDLSKTLPAFAYRLYLVRWRTHLHRLQTHPSCPIWSRLSRSIFPLDKITIWLLSQTNYPNTARIIPQMSRLCLLSCTEIPLQTYLLLECFQVICRENYLVFSLKWFSQALF